MGVCGGALPQSSITSNAGRKPSPEGVLGFVLAPCRAGEQQLSPDPVKFGQTEPVLVLFRHDHPFFERAQTLLYLPAFSAHLAKPCIKQWQRILGPGGAHAGDALAQFRTTVPPALPASTFSIGDVGHPKRPSRAAASR